MSKCVMVFGTFDGLHDGHRFFLNEAKKIGDRLVIIVAKDQVTLSLKNESPLIPEKKRVAKLKSEFKRARVILGDNNDNEWKIIEKIKPDFIAIGYDQTTMLRALENVRLNFKKPPILVVLPDHMGDVLHSSILKNKNTP